MIRSAMWLRSVAVLYGLLCTLCLVSIALDQTGVRFATKALPLVLLAYWVRRQPATPALLFLQRGLWFCALGDFLLEFTWLENSFGVPWFALGLAAFLLAHCCYIMAFMRLPSENRWYWLVPVLMWTVGLGYVLWPSLGSMKLPVVLYISVITVMIWRALCLKNCSRGLMAMAAVGALLFGLSDSLIAINRFLTPLPAARLLISLSYWQGQWFITAAVIHLALHAASARSKSPVKFFK